MLVRPHRGRPGWVGRDVDRGHRWKVGWPGYEALKPHGSGGSGSRGERFAM